MNQESEMEQEEHIQGEGASPPPAVLFCGLIYSGHIELRRVLTELTEVWGPVDFVGRKISFSYTNYYDDEMGSNLFRKFVMFQKLVPQEGLPDLKGASRTLETRFLCSNGGRMVNIDPGLFLSDKLVLATTKPSANRPYLGHGVYADVMLVFENKSYRALRWTYPDYAEEETLRMLNTLRKRYRFRSRWNAQS